MVVQVREVWADNVDKEFEIISSIIDDYPFISMDTEFPGVVHRHKDRDTMSPTLNYSVLKQNVDALNIIQFGLTLSDSQGNFPSVDSDKYTYIWQFNFKDFNLSRDRHAPDSVELLRVNGIDFDRNLKDGIDSWHFSELMMSSGLVCSEGVVWVTFHGAYDFGYVLKVLTQRPLPSELRDFTGLIAIFFGEKVFDVKYMIKFCNGLYGGLDRVAKTLNIERAVGKSHQAGSDSHLTWMVFMAIRDRGYFTGGIDRYAGSYFGLEVS
ncbi:putative CCR4-associated factor 1 homolog 9 [Silene latifolia]|uniref:putative CCR4-associated factor 1 homolog 9 n=1 Tax=Silene latifolia TaxID=37657 RepID=UPI003D77E3DC